MKIRTNQERFLTLSKMADLSNETEKPKQKNCNKPRKFLVFLNHFGIEQQSGNPKKKNFNKPTNIPDFTIIELIEK